MRAELARAVAGARSVRVPQPDRLAALAQLDCVVVIGASCAGKTTLVDGVRGSELVASGRVEVPPRLITRPRRAGDNLLENVHVSPEGFAAQAQSGAIGLRWIRRIAEREVRYGFRPPRAGALPVYSANNAIVAADASVEPAAALAHALVIGVHAPDPERARRLARRSPDLWDRPDELAHRLGEPADQVFTDAHLVIANHGELAEVAAADLLAIVRALVG